MRNILFVVIYGTRDVHEVGQSTYLCCGSASDGSDCDHNDVLATSTCWRYKPEHRKSPTKTALSFLCPLHLTGQTLCSPAINLVELDEV